jgi:hypothetical protein
MLQHRIQWHWRRAFLQKANRHYLGRKRLKIKEATEQRWIRLGVQSAIAKPSGKVGEDLVHADYELDSLGFPELVARLEDTLGADDRFAATEDAIFSETFGDFVKAYEHGGH